MNHLSLSRQHLGSPVAQMVVIQSSAVLAIRENEPKQPLQQLIPDGLALVQPATPRPASDLVLVTRQQPVGQIGR